MKKKKQKQKNSRFCERDFHYPLTAWEKNSSPQSISGGDWYLN